MSPPAECATDEELSATLRRVARGVGIDEVAVASDTLLLYDGERGESWCRRQA